MARDLKKFVNPKFLKTVDLGLFRRLFARQPETQRGFDLAGFEGEDGEVRDRLRDFFEGPEDGLPRGIVADLHHIAELGTQNGMQLLQERAAARDIAIAAPLDANGEPIPLDPKHFAILAFLDHRSVFDAASDMLARQARSSLAEYVGLDEGVEPRLDDASRAAFEAAAAELFRRDHRGAFCRVGWYEDDDQTVLVVTHGAPVAVIPVISDDREDVSLDVWPAVYDQLDLEWEDDNFWDCQISSADAEGYPISLVHDVGSNVRARHWTISFSDPTNPAGTVELARLWMGPLWSPQRNLRIGSQFGWEPRAVADYSLGGVLFSEARAPARVLRVTLPLLSQTEALGTMLDAQRRLGTDGELWVIPNADDTTRRFKRDVMARFRKLDPLTQFANRLHETSFELEEIL